MYCFIPFSFILKYCFDIAEMYIFMFLFQPPFQAENRKKTIEKVGCFY